MLPTRVRRWQRCLRNPGVRGSTGDLFVVPEVSPPGTTVELGQLSESDPACWPVAPGWQATVDDFFASAHGVALCKFLDKRLTEGAVIFPPKPLRALELTPPDAVRIIILGQDPYHARGQADGLAFSVAPGIPLPPSLRNIFKELLRDRGMQPPHLPQPGGSLEHWANAGVLLLNTCLTVEEGRPASHSGQGWEALSDAVILRISQVTQPVVFMLWGAHAQSKRALIDAQRHKVLTANHPSPLSALRMPSPFIGCGHFSQAKAWLATPSWCPGDGPQG